MARPRPAAAAQSSACEHDNAVGLTSILYRGQFSSLKRRRAAVLQSYIPYVNLSDCYAVRIVCGKRYKTVECPSVCLSQRSDSRSRFAAEVWRGSRYRSIAATAARNAGRVNFGPLVRRSDIVAVGVSDAVQHL